MVAVMIGIAVVIAIGLIGHAVATFVFARSDEGQSQARGHELGYW